MKKEEKRIHWNQFQGKYLKNIVYGGLDGIITTFAVVAGVAGASLSSGIALILGFANLIADGISMAIGDYFSTKSEREFQKKEFLKESKELKNNPKEEKQEEIEKYTKAGMSKKEAEKVVNVLIKHKNIFLKKHVTSELNFVYETESPLKNSLATFFSFLIFGFIPLSFYLLGFISESFIRSQFILSIVLTIIALAILGTFKSKITGKSKTASVIETIIIGGLAASAAYTIGLLLGQLA